MDINIENFREGIFALHTRRFGTVAELMIELLYKFDPSNVLNFDKKDGNNNKRVEVKFSNVIKQCLNASTVYRAFNSTETKMQKFDCNIQQIKNKEFDILYYGVFFKDHIEIFKIENDKIETLKNYSNKQHRGNIGEGQFHLNNANIDQHRKEYLIQILSYEELYKLFQEAK